MPKHPNDADKIALCFGTDCPYKNMCQRYTDSLASDSLVDQFVGFDIRPITRKRFSHYRTVPIKILVDDFPFFYYKTRWVRKEVWVDEPITDPFECDGMVLNNFIEDEINATTPQ